jgi:hypothetical protein
MEALFQRVVECNKLTSQVAEHVKGGSKFKAEHENVSSKAEHGNVSGESKAKENEGYYVRYGWSQRSFPNACFLAPTSAPLKMDGMRVGKHFFIVFLLLN